jgi:uncharacterized membrane protein YGL010W
MENWRARIMQSVLILLVVSVAARVVYGLLGPLLPSLLVLFVLGWLLQWILRGPHSGH